jgi:transcription antitermination factor NusG
MLVQLETYQRGTRIRVARGPLAGLNGKIAKISNDDGKYFVTIDGWAKGVYLIADADILAVEQAEG